MWSAASLTHYHYLHMIVEGEEKLQNISCFMLYIRVSALEYTLLNF